MDARIQQKIAPPSTAKPQHFREALPTQAASPATAGAADTAQVDFKQVLLNSQKEARSKRQAESNGDLSKAKNYQEFLDGLNRKDLKKGLPQNHLGKEDFLTLFITQLQHQDPLNPKDGTEMASQLAQFNSLEQMMNMNEALERLEQKASKGHNIQFVDYIGKEVTVKDGRVGLQDGKVGEVTYKIELPVNSSTLQIRNASGDVVAELEQGPKAQGNHHIVWDGRNTQGETLPNGVYTFGLVGKGQGGASVDIPLSSQIKITGIDLQEKNGASFYTNVGKVSYSDIAEIGEQDFKRPQAPAQAVQPPAGQAQPSAVQPLAAPSLEPSFAEQKTAEQVPDEAQPAATQAQPSPPDFYPELHKPFSSLEAYQTKETHTPGLIEVAS